MSNLVLGCQYIEEHVIEIVEDVVKYLRKYHKEGRSPEEVKARFEKLENEESVGDLSVSESGALEDGFGETDGNSWVDFIGGGMYALADLYELIAPHKDGDFVVIDDNSYVTVLAVCGCPGANEIGQVLKNFRDPHYVAAANDFAWPDFLGKGASIEKIYFDACGATLTLKNGKELEIETK